MVKVRFVSADGSAVDAEGRSGDTLMECALENMIPEIEGLCGGSCACATCHCYPRDEWQGRLSPRDDFELATLQGGQAEVKQSSRLACQIVLSEQLSGLVVDLPEP